MSAVPSTPQSVSPSVSRPAAPLRDASVSPARATPRAPVALRASVTCPLLLTQVAAGFPSPADDYLDRPLDIAEYLIRHPEATFFLRAQGYSMTGAGIHDGDLLVVDRAVEPVHNKVAIVAVDGELTVKRLHLRAGRVVLLPENPDYEPLDVTGRDDVHVWGVVTYVVHAL